MISEFHQDDEYRSKSSIGTKRGIGKIFKQISFFYKIQDSFFNKYFF